MVYNQAIKALLIGINYSSKPRLRLNGCINDVLLAQDYLANQMNADPKNVTVMLDQDGYELPTRNNMLRALKTFLQSGRRGDVLLLHYSGHGTQVPDKHGNIIQEGLVPLDAEDMGSHFSNLILDNEFEDLVLQTPSGVTLYVVLDCCYGGGEIEKLGTRLRNIILPHNTLGAPTRAAIPRNLQTNQQNTRAVPKLLRSVSTTSIAGMLRSCSSARKDLQIVAFSGGSKFEPVADASFHYKGFGAFSYYFYHTMILNKDLVNLHLIDSVKASVKKANYSQGPQLIVSHEENGRWIFLTEELGNEDVPNIAVPRSITSMSASNVRSLDDSEIRELHLVDTSATLQVNHLVEAIARKEGEPVPFIVKDITRVFAAVVGLAIHRIAHDHGLPESTATATANTAIKETARQVFDLLLGKRIEQPTIASLMENLVIPTIRRAIVAVVSKVDISDIETCAFDACAHMLANVTLALSHPVERCVVIATECTSRVNVRLADTTPETHDFVRTALDLATQVIATIAASNIYEFTTKKVSVGTFASDIAKHVSRSFDNEFQQKLLVSTNPRDEVQKFCVNVIEDIVAKYPTHILTQDFADSVSEITIRFANFAPLASPMGHVLAGTLEARNAGSSSGTALPLVESFVGPLCKCTVDEVVGANVRAVPVMFKVAAKGVAEVAAHSVIDLLKQGEGWGVEPVTLAGVVQVVAKNAATKVLDLLNNSKAQSETSSHERSLGSLFGGALSAFAPIAVSAAQTGLKMFLHSTTRSPGELTFETQQALANNANVTAPHFLYFLPYLDHATSLVKACLESVTEKNLGKANERAVRYGVEVLATTLASLVKQQEEDVRSEVAKEIAKEAAIDFASTVQHEDIFINDPSYFVTAITNSLKKALSNSREIPSELKQISRQTLQETVAKIAATFRPFSPSHILVTHESVSPSIDVRAIFSETKHIVTEKLSSERAIPPFLLKLGKATSQVVASAMMDVLASKGVLSNNGSRGTNVQNLSKRVKDTAVNIGLSVVNDILESNPNLPNGSPGVASTTVLEKLIDTVIPAVSGEVSAITGRTAGPEDEVEVANAVGERTRAFGALLPMLASVAPALIQGVSGLISSGFRSAAGSTSGSELVALATMNMLSENADILETKTNGSVNHDVIIKVVDRAIQNYKSQNSAQSADAHLAIRSAVNSFELKGDGMKLFTDDYIDSHINRAAQISHEATPSHAAYTDAKQSGSAQSQQQHQKHQNKPSKKAKEAAKHPLVGPIAHMVVKQLLNEKKQGTRGNRAIPPFVKVIAKSAAEVAANSMLEVLKNSETKSTTLNSILVTVAKHAANKVIKLADRPATGSRGIGDFFKKVGNILPSVAKNVGSVALQVGQMALSNPALVQGVMGAVMGNRGVGMPNEADIQMATQKYTPKYLPNWLQAVHTVNTAVSGAPTPRSLDKRAAKFAALGSNIAAMSAARLASKETDKSFSKDSVQDFADKAVDNFLAGVQRIKSTTWDKKILKSQVASAVHQAASEFPGLKNKTKEEITRKVNSVARKFVPFMPKHAGKKAATIAHVEEKIVAKLESGDRGFKLPSVDFLKTIALGAGKMAVSAAMDVAASHAQGADLKDTLLNVGLKTAQGVMSNIFGGSSRGLVAGDSTPLLNELLESAQKVIDSEFKEHFGEEKTRELHGVVADSLVHNTRFFGALLPILSTVAPALISTVGNLAAGAFKKRSGPGSKANELAAFTTATMLAEQRVLSAKPIDEEAIENAVESAVSNVSNSRQTSEDIAYAVEDALLASGAYAKAAPELNKIQSRVVDLSKLMELPQNNTRAAPILGGPDLLKRKHAVVSALALDAVKQLVAEQKATDRSITIPPLVKVLAKHVAEIGAKSVLEVLKDSNVHPVTLNSVLTTVAKNSAQKVLTLTDTASAGTPGSRSFKSFFSKVTSKVLPAVKTIAIEGVKFAGQAAASFAQSQMSNAQVENQVSNAVDGATTRSFASILGAAGNIVGLLANSILPRSLDAKSSKYVSAGASIAASVASCVGTDANLGDVSEFIEKTVSIFQSGALNVTNWNQQVLIAEVSRALKATLKETPELSKFSWGKVEVHLKKVVKMFKSFLPKEKDALAAIDQHVTDKLSARQERSLTPGMQNPSLNDFSKSIAFKAAKFAAGVAQDVLKAHDENGSWTESLKKVGAQTAKGVLGNILGGTRSLVPTSMLDDIVARTHKVVVREVLSQTNLSEDEASKQVTSSIAGNTRFFGALLPMLASAAPALISTVGNIASGLLGGHRDLSGSKDAELAAFATASILAEQRGQSPQPITDELIAETAETAVKLLSSPQSSQNSRSSPARPTYAAHSLGKQGISVPAGSGSEHDAVVRAVEGALSQARLDDVVSTAQIQTRVAGFGNFIKDLGGKVGLKMPHTNNNTDLLSRLSPQQIEELKKRVGKHALLLESLTLGAVKRVVKERKAAGVATRAIPVFVKVLAKSAAEIGAESVLELVDENNIHPTTLNSILAVVAQKTAQKVIKALDNPNSQRGIGGFFKNIGNKIKKTATVAVKNVAKVGKQVGKVAVPILQQAVPMAVSIGASAVGAPSLAPMLANMASMGMNAIPVPRAVNALGEEEIVGQVVDSRIPESFPVLMDNIRDLTDLVDAAPVTRSGDKQERKLAEVGSNIVATVCTLIGNGINAGKDIIRDFAKRAMDAFHAIIGKAKDGFANLKELVMQAINKALSFIPEIKAKADVVIQRVKETFGLFKSFIPKAKAFISSAIDEVKNLISSKNRGFSGTSKFMKQIVIYTAKVTARVTIDLLENMNKEQKEEKDAKKWKVFLKEVAFKSVIQVLKDFAKDEETKRDLNVNPSSLLAIIQRTIQTKVHEGFVENFGREVDNQKLEKKISKSLKLHIGEFGSLLPTLAAANPALVSEVGHLAATALHKSRSATSPEDTEVAAFTTMSLLAENRGMLGEETTDADILQAVNRALKRLPQVGKEENILVAVDHAVSPITAWKEEQIKARISAYKKLICQEESEEPSADHHSSSGHRSVITNGIVPPYPEIAAISHGAVKQVLAHRKQTVYSERAISPFVKVIAKSAAEIGAKTVLEVLKNPPKGTNSATMNAVLSVVAKETAEKVLKLLEQSSSSSSRGLGGLFKKILPVVGKVAQTGLTVASTVISNPNMVNGVMQMVMGRNVSASDDAVNDAMNKVTPKLLSTLMETPGLCYLVSNILDGAPAILGDKTTARFVTVGANMTVSVAILLAFDEQARIGFEVAQTFAKQAVATFISNADSIKEWKRQMIAEEVEAAVKNAIKNSPQIKNKVLNNVETTVRDVEEMFKPFYPKPQSAKTLARIQQDMQKSNKRDINERGIPPFLQSLALTAGKMALGAAKDVIVAKSSGQNWKDAVLSAGANTAQGVLGQLLGGGATRGTEDQPVMATVMEVAHRSVKEEVEKHLGKDVSDQEIKESLSYHTRFFGGLLPIFQSVAPALISTVGNIAMGALGHRGVGSSEDVTLAAATTTSLLAMHRGAMPQVIPNEIIANAAEASVENLSDSTLERAIERAIQKCGVAGTETITADDVDTHLHLVKKFMKGAAVHGQTHQLYPHKKPQLLQKFGPFVKQVAHASVKQLHSEAKLNNTRAIPSFVKVVAKQAAEVGAKSVLEVLSKSETQHSPITLSSVLVAVAKNSAKKVIDVLSEKESSARSAGTKLTTIVKGVEEAVADGVLKANELARPATLERKKSFVKFADERARSTRNLSEDSLSEDVSEAVAAHRGLFDSLLGVVGNVVNVVASSMNRGGSGDKFEQLGASIIATVTSLITSDDQFREFHETAARIFRANVQSIQNWNPHTLEKEVGAAIKEALQDHPHLAKKEQHKADKTIHQVVKKFAPFFPKSSSKKTRGASSDLESMAEEVSNHIEADGHRGLLASIALGAAKMAVGAAKDAIGSAITSGIGKLGLGAAKAVINSVVNGRKRGIENGAPSALCDIIETTRAVVLDEVLTEGKRQGKSEEELTKAVDSSLQYNTRFFGALLPALSFAAPHIISTVGSIASALLPRGASAASTETDNEVAAFATASLLQEHASSSREVISDSQIEDVATDAVRLLSSTADCQHAVKKAIKSSGINFAEGGPTQAEIHTRIHQIVTALAAKKHQKSHNSAATNGTRGILASLSFQALRSITPSIATGSVNQLLAEEPLNGQRAIPPHIKVLAVKAAEVAVLSLIDVAQQYHDTGDFSMLSALYIVAKNAAKKAFAEVNPFRATDSIGRRASGKFQAMFGGDNQKMPVNKEIAHIASLVASSPLIPKNRSNTSGIENVVEANARDLNTMFDMTPMVVDGISNVTGSRNTTSKFHAKFESVGSSAVATVAGFLLSRRNKTDKQFMKRCLHEFHAKAPTVQKWTEDILEKEVYAAVSSGLKGNSMKVEDSELRKTVSSVVKNYVPFFPVAKETAAVRGAPVDPVEEAIRQVKEEISLSHRGIFKKVLVEGAKLAIVAAAESGGKELVKIGYETAKDYYQKHQASKQTPPQQPTQPPQPTALSNIVENTRAVVVSHLKEEGIRESDVNDAVLASLNHNTRFFGALLPMLTTVAPSIISTVVNLATKRSTSSASSDDKEVVAYTTSTILSQYGSTAKEPITADRIEELAAKAVDLFDPNPASPATPTGSSGSRTMSSPRLAISSRSQPLSSNSKLPGTQERAIVKAVEGALAGIEFNPQIESYQTLAITRQFLKVLKNKTPTPVPVPEIQPSNLDDQPSTKEKFLERKKTFSNLQEKSQFGLSVSLPSSPSITPNGKSHHGASEAVKEVGLPDNADALAEQLMAVYGSYHLKETVRTPIAQAIQGLMDNKDFAKFPRSYVLEIAKAAGSAAAVELIRTVPVRGTATKAQMDAAVAFGTNVIANLVLVPKFSAIGERL